MLDPNSQALNKSLVHTEHVPKIINLKWASGAGNQARRGISRCV